LLPESFGRAVRARRAELGITQSELAERAGIDTSYVGGVERGDHNPTLGMVERIAKGLGKMPSEMVTAAEGISKEPKKQ
jgi:transcriptional regulator with XRE-family HTH domain